MIAWHQKRVLVTGGHGFLGSWLCEALQKKGAKHLIIPTRSECDLIKESDIERLLSSEKPHIVLHAAAFFGSVRMMAERQGDIFYQNTMMNTLLMEYARRAGVERYVAVGSGAMYPETASLPYKEEDLWNGPMEDIAACYGFPKKAQVVQAQTYKAQYGFHAIMCILGNLYGPRDHFDEEKSTVIPGMMKKFHMAKKDNASELVVWGDGTQTRDFIYVEDAAEGVLSMAEKLPAGEWINLSNGTEVSVRTLAETIQKLIGYTGNIRWEKQKGVGQRRRVYDVTKAKKLSFMAKTPLSEGLEKTIAWYQENVTD